MNPVMVSARNMIAFQGRAGAYSDLACRAVRPGWQTLPCDSFAGVIEAVCEGRASEALLPCENSLAGRVPEIHILLPEASLSETGLRIIGEHFQRIEHCLIGLRGTQLSDIRRVHSHPVALAQVRRFVRRHHLEAVNAFDTAGAAEKLAEWGRKEEGAIASSLAARLNGLEIIARNIEDAAHNTTRFYHVAGKNAASDMTGMTCGVMTTLMVSIRNTSGALYDVLGCFARYGVNMTRIESYMLNGSFAATRFLIDVEADLTDVCCREVLGSLNSVCHNIHILGVYGRSRMRDTAPA